MAIIKAYSRIGRASPFDIKDDSLKKDMVTQNEINAELLNFFKSLLTIATK